MAQSFGVYYLGHHNREVSMFYRIMLILVGLGASLILGSYSCQAQQVTVTITGEKQGTLKGTAPSQEPNATSAVLSFSYEVDVGAIDTTSGVGAGKRQTSAIVFSRHTDGASPSIYTSLTTNEILSSVKFDFFAPTANSTEKPYYTIVLTNAHIVKFVQQTGSATDKSLIDIVSLTFQKIEEASISNNKTAADSPGSWNRIQNVTNLSQEPI
jgi:type VI secretion system Hcp family effector